MTPHPEQTRKCSNCMWWWNSVEGARNGECRGSPPIADYTWRRSRDIDWCSSFRMKEPERVVHSYPPDSVRLPDGRIV